MPENLPENMPREGFDFSKFADVWTLPLMVLDRNLRFVYANRAYLTSVKRTWDQLESQYIFDAFPDSPERREPVESMFRATLNGEITHLDAQPYELKQPDGSVSMRVWQCVQEPYLDANGTITHLVQRAEDVTEQAELQRRNDIISAELDHRVKNLLTVIMATARLAGKRARSVEAFSHDFNERLVSMNRTYTRLSGNDWKGLTLQSLLEEELNAVTDRNSDRFSLSGKDVTLSIKSTKDAAMIIHELATNAVKYGCFSVPEGRLAVDWTLSEDLLIVTWSETGLTGISAPDHEGFGTVLFGMMPNISITRDYRDCGLLVQISVPVSIAVNVVDFG